MNNALEAVMRQNAAASKSAHFFENLAGPLDALQTNGILSLEELITQHIEEVLALHGGNISAAARALGMNRRTLQRKLRKLRPSDPTPKTACS